MSLFDYLLGRRLATFEEGEQRVGVIAGIPFTVMSAFRVIPVQANIGLLLILQDLTFIVSLLYGLWRYR